MTEFPLRGIQRSGEASCVLLKKRFVLLGLGLLVGSIGWETGEETTWGGGSSLTRGEEEETWFSSLVSGG